MQSAPPSVCRRLRAPASRRGYDRRMSLAIGDVRPMLGRLTRALPEEGYLYEPKWDGFRSLAFRDGDAVELQSRHGRPFARYFPELVAAFRELAVERCVLDGEVLVSDGEGWSFPA